MTHKSLEDLVVDALAVDEVVEELVYSFGLVLRHHVTRSFNSNHCKVLVVGLVKTCVLVLYVPGTPLSGLRTVQFLHVLFGVGKRHNVVKISAIEPHSYGSVGEDAHVFVDGPSLGNGVVESGADRPVFGHIFNVVGVLVEIPVVDGSSVGQTVGNFLQRVALFAVDVGL